MGGKNIITNQPSWRHQRALRNVLYHLLYEIDLARFDPLPLARFDDSDRLSDVADLVVIDRVTKRPVVVIEVANRSEWVDTEERLWLVLDDYPHIAEIFMLNYETLDWLAIRRPEYIDEDDDAELRRLLEQDLDPERLFRPIDEDEEDAWNDITTRPTYCKTLKVDLGPLPILREAEV